MIKKLIIFTAIALCLFSGGCKKDDDATPKFQHNGDKWAITSFDYALVSQKTNPISAVIDAGTATNAGYFYLNGATGSFDITIKTTHVEDYFTYSESGNDITVASVNQSVAGVSISQYVIAFSGSKDGTTKLNISGTITKQTTSEQFSLSGSMTLVKQ